MRQSKEGQRAALVVDVREGMRLDEFPAILKKVRKVLPTRVVFLEASDEALVRRFSETRRPHPLGRSDTVCAIDQGGAEAAGSYPQCRGYCSGYDEVQCA